MKKGIIIAVCAIVVLISAVVAAYHLGRAYVGSIFGAPEPVAFSQEAWDADPYNRGPMVKDLLEQYDFLSMTKEEVIALLGEKRLTVWEYNEKQGSGTLNYETGGGYLKDEILFFEFDETGKIVDLGIRN